MFWTGALSVVIGLVLASAFSAILVYAQELMPGRLGMVSGLFFGFAFGMGGLGAAALGVLADATSITFVYRALRVPARARAADGAAAGHRGAAAAPRARLTPPMRLLAGALGSPVRNLAGGAAFVATVVALAMVGYTASGWSLGDALYMAVLTVFTVGYDEVRPIDTPALRASPSA